MIVDNEYEGGTSPLDPEITSDKETDIDTAFEDNVPPAVVMVPELEVEQSSLSHDSVTVVVLAEVVAPLGLMEFI